MFPYLPQEDSVSAPYWAATTTTTRCSICQLLRPKTSCRVCRANSAPGLPVLGCALAFMKTATKPAWQRRKACWPNTPTRKRLWRELCAAAHRFWPSTPQPCAASPPRICLPHLVFAAAHAQHGTPRRWRAGRQPPRPDFFS
mgnify:CR=1 FL=1